ncbi:mitogen-activated protein kinase kinase kinase [Thalictrum thalictroides]|uniref:Mitogen-activated protein kinase kinase kinase n=1 Tax=Thalictrum thalictroides TaxID=46969 RepID=A0A7J6VUV1_THATH|nr:mitogen-activated protein kinase kinase kinase [Thalictrum thalictroides]
MITGRPDADVSALLFRIGFGEEVPEIPVELLEEGKDFLRKCFIRDPTKRWTAEMLLNHPFVHDVTVTCQIMNNHHRLQEVHSSFLIGVRLNHRHCCVVIKNKQINGIVQFLLLLCQMIEFDN